MRGRDFVEFFLLEMVLVDLNFNLEDIPDHSFNRRLVDDGTL